MPSGWDGWMDGWMTGQFWFFTSLIKKTLNNERQRDRRKGEVRDKNEINVTSLSGGGEVRRE